MTAKNLVSSNCCPAFDGITMLGIVIELQDVEKVICLNENHPSVVLVLFR